MDQEFWAVAQTAPSLEQVAGRQLGERGFDVFYPRAKEWQTVRGKVTKVPRPIFPGYIFFFVVTSWWKARDCDAVSRVLMSGETPASLPYREIAMLRARADDDGLINLPKRKFVSGQRVRVEAEGPFYGYEGLYEGQPRLERARVLFQMLGRATSVELSERDLVAA